MIDAGSHQKSCSLKILYTSPLLSCLCHPGSSSTRTIFYLASTKAIPPSTDCFEINPKLTGSFSDTFPCIQQPTTLPLICSGTCSMSSKGTRLHYNYGKLKNLNSLGLGTRFFSIKSEQIRKIVIDND